jgi:hypothetical protein
MFSYNQVHRVVVCTLCRSCVIPGRQSLERYLRAAPHRLLGAELKTTLELLCSYSLRPAPELKENKPWIEDQCQVIDGLECYSGFVCLQSDCQYATRQPREIRKHMPSVHQVKAAAHKKSALWKECKLQTYFTAKGLIDYFVVVDDSRSKKHTFAAADKATLLTEGEKACFEKIEEDYQKIKEEIAKEAGIVHDFEDSRSARVPWLERTGFPFHLKDLEDAEIYSSYKLPSDRELEEGGVGDPVLARIIGATKSLLQEAYELCSDTSPDRKMTHQRACILNEFYAGATGKSDAFRYYKMASSLVQYFNTWTQFVVYYYRVVYAEDGHFTQRESSHQVPKHVIQPTELQQKALCDVIKAATDKANESENEAVLKHLLRRFFFALICHVVGSVPFRSPILSFCAMLGRSVRMTKVAEGDEIKAKGQWKEPGIFSSHLSALTWTAQLLIFDYACFQEQEDENQIPVFLSKICKQFFQQLAETPFGHILQWRLYLFQTSRRQLAKHQARWSLDKQTVGYRGTDLHMSHIPKLVLSEYEQAQSILYQDFLFQASDLIPLQSWKLKDDLDMLDFRESWLTNPENTELLKGSEVALLQRIQQSPELRSMFLVEGRDSAIVFNPRAIDVYEAKVQDFLKRMLIFIHLTGGQRTPRASSTIRGPWPIRRGLAEISE